MFKDFDEAAVDCGCPFGLFPKDDFARAALKEFSNTHGAVPDDLLAESGGDVMTFSAEAGNYAFPTERLRAWAIDQLGKSVKLRVYTCDLVN